MATILFKEGNSDEYKGVKCDKIKVEPRSIQAHLDQGWKLSVDELYAKPEVLVQEIVQEEKPKKRRGRPKSKEV